MGLARLVSLYSISLIQIPELCTDFLSTTFLTLLGITEPQNILRPIQWTICLHADLQKVTLLIQIYFMTKACEFTHFSPILLPFTKIYQKKLKKFHSMEDFTPK